VGVGDLYQPLNNLLSQLITVFLVWEFPEDFLVPASEDLPEVIFLLKNLFRHPGEQKQQAFLWIFNCFLQ